MTDLNQKELVKKLKAKDPDSIILLHNTYGEKIYYLALHMTGSVEYAEDITQETIVHVYQKIKSFKQQNNLFIWIYTIAKDLCLLSNQKQQKASFATLDKLVNTFQDPDSVSQYSDFEKRYYIKQIKYGCLTGIIRCLSFHQRMAFILHILLEEAIAEVAVVLERSVSATRSLIQRARCNIKNFMCKNCSLYDSNNHCTCENLIDFSLKQNWIHTPSSYSALHVEQPIESEQIEEEISSIKKITLLYKSLPHTEPTQKMVQKLKQAIKTRIM